MRVFAAGLALASLAFLALARGALAQAPIETGAFQRLLGATVLTVSAEGQVKIAPDIATINIGVVASGRTAQEAMTDNTAKMGAVIAALRRTGIADKDIQTENLSVNPQYQYIQNEPPKLSGYQASNSVRVKVRNLREVGAAVDRVVAVGSNQINGIRFALDDDSKAMDQARLEALKKARARAELYAAAAGLKVDRIISISETGAYAPPIPIVAMARAAPTAAPPPVAPGELTITASLTVMFALK